MRPRWRGILAGGIVLVAVSFLLPLAFPVYFRDDDVAYLHWARTHGFLDSFDPGKATLFGMFRPVQNLVWWLLYHAAGLDPYPYQVVITLTYLVAFGCFVGFAGSAFSRSVSLMTAIAYLAGFHFLMYIIFWFSDLTYTLEIMLAHAALWCLAAAANPFSWPRLTAGLALFLGAVLAKEPAAIMVPFGFVFLVSLRWSSLGRGDRIRLAAAAIILLAAGASWILLTPSLRSRQGIPADSLAVAWRTFIQPRWDYYAQSFAAPPSLLIVAAPVFLVIQRLIRSFRLSASLRTAMALAAASILTLLLKANPAILLAVLVGASLALVFLRHPAGLGAVMAIPALLGIMTIGYMVRTYLVEASFGLALACGVALHECRMAFPLDSVFRHTARRVKWAAIVAAGGTAALAMLVLLPSLSEKLAALRLLSANRQTLAMSVEYFSNARGEVPGTLLVIDYQDMGLVYERDILPMRDLEKAARQKTMSSSSLHGFLHPITGIAVRNLAWWKTNETGTVPAMILTMNPSEEEFLAGLPGKATRLREWRSGKARAGLYRLEPAADGD